MLARITRPLAVLTATLALTLALTPTTAEASAPTTIEWAHGFGDGGARTVAVDVATDPAGNIVMVGRFGGSVDFDPGPGSRVAHATAAANGFILKLSPTGSLIWVTQIASDDYSRIDAVAVDPSGAIYVTGSFKGETLFNVDDEEDTIHAVGDSDGFIAKYGSDGSYKWVATAVGGAAYPYDIAVDGSGKAFATGEFYETVNFRPGGVALELTGDAHGFVWALDSNGDTAWVRHLSSDEYASGFGVDTADDGSVYVAGGAWGTTDFDPSGAGLIMESVAEGDAFVLKLTAQGAITWLATVTGAGDVEATRLAVDSTGSAYVLGRFNGTADLDPDGAGHQITQSGSGSYDAFVARFGADGSFQWVHRMESVLNINQPPQASVSLGSNGAVYIAADLQGAGDLDPNGAGFPVDAFGSRNGVLVVLGPNGAFLWGRELGTSSTSLVAHGIAPAADGHSAIAVGEFTGTAQLGDGFSLTASGVFTDAFVLELGPPPTPTVGLVDPTQGQWHLRNGSGAVTSFYFGNPGDFPIMGDWNCNGVDTPGMYRQSDGYVYLKNSNTQGVADIRFFFGNPGDVPIAGDFNGNGCDTVSIYRPSNQTFYIINALGANDGGLGAAQFSYVFGNPGDKPFTGDFNGNGTDTVGLHRESTGFVYFRNTHTQGNADNQFFFGDPNDRFITGDWNGNGTDTPGLFRPGNTTFYFRFTNTQGNADDQFVWGSSGWLPVSGVFGLG